MDTSDEKWTIRLWHIVSGLVRINLRSGPVEELAFSPDENLLAIRYRDGVIEITNIERNERLLQWNLGETGQASPVVSRHIEFSPDSLQLAASTGVNGAIQVLELGALRERLTPLGLGWK